MATSRPRTRSAARATCSARIEEDGVEFVRFWFTDILGQLKSFSVGREEMEGALEQGMGFDGSSITGFNAIEESDMIAMPDPDTYALLPWRTDGDKGNVARLFCDVLRPGGEPYEGDPRYVMRRALERAEDMGFDHFYIGPELEFFYFRSDELGESGVPEILDKGGYFDLTTLDAGSDLRRDTVNALKALGIRVEYTHHEVGPSQHEIDMRYAGGLEMSDNAMTYRIVVKEIAAQHGVYATFMPKPLFGENGSGMHTHQSLFTSDGNAFFDADDQYHLSTTAKVVHRRPAEARARDRGAVRPQREQLQAARAGLRGPGLQRLVAAQPLGAGPGPDVPPGQGAVDARGAALPGPVLQSLPDVRGDAALGAGRDRAGLRVPRPDGEQPLRPHARRARRARHRAAPRDARRVDRGVRRVGPDAASALGDHIFERYVDLKREEWEEYRVQVSKWELERYLPIL